MHAQCVDHNSKKKQASDAMDGAKDVRLFLRKVRSSKAFVLTVINLAVFSLCSMLQFSQCEILTPSASADAYLYALIIPVLPFALVERVQLHQDEVQLWIGILLAAYGAGLLVGSRKSRSPCPSCVLSLFCSSNNNPKRLLHGLPIVVIPVKGLTSGDWSP